MSMNAAVQLLAAGDDAAVALICDDERVDYATLRERVARAAAVWRARGVRPGDRVIVFAPDSIDWAAAYLGIIHAGGVAVGVNARLPMADLVPLLKDSAAVAIWCEPAQAPAVSALLAELSSGTQAVVADAAWFAAVAAAAPIAAELLDADAPAFWIGTSGTTGLPKAAIHAQRAANGPDRFARGVLGLTAADRLYASSKLFFAYALGNSLFAGLRAGATVILDRDWPTPARVEEMIRRHRPTLVFCVPTLYNKMLQDGVATRLAGLGIRHFVSAGEALSESVRASWQDATGLAPISGYGTTETLCLMLYSDRADGRMRPTPGTVLRHPPELPADRPRRVWLQAETVALGYWNRPEAQADGFSEGWFSPGDQFLPGADGSLEFAGRNDDLLKIAGQWVSTLWVEQQLVAACGDCVSQVAVVAVTGESGLAALAALAVALPGQEAFARDALAAAIETLPGHRRPRWVHWLDALPVTATGKLQRGALRAVHEQALRR